MNSSQVLYKRRAVIPLLPHWSLIKSIISPVLGRTNEHNGYKVIKTVARNIVVGGMSLGNSGRKNFGWKIKSKNLLEKSRKKIGRKIREKNFIKISSSKPFGYDFFLQFFDQFFFWIFPSIFWSQFSIRNFFCDLFQTHPSITNVSMSVFTFRIHDLLANRDVVGAWAHRRMVEAPMRGPRPEPG